MVGYFVETEVDIFNVDCISLESLAKNNQSPVVNSIREVILIVTLDLYVDWIIFVVSFFEIGAESFMSLNIRLLAHITILSQQLSFD
jgi:hypothetical protein